MRATLGRMEMPEEFEDVRPDLRPVVRTRSYLETLRVQSEIEGSPFIPVPYTLVGDHLLACLVYDLPSSMMYVTQEHLETWGVSLYEAMEVALQNLGENPVNLMGIDNRLYSPVAGDAYDASRMLLTEKLEKLEVQGQYVAMAVNRDTLLITGDDDETGLEMMADLAEKSLEEPRPLCPIPVRFEDGQWQTWMPPEEHPQFARFKMFSIRFLLEEYERQKTQLDQLHEAKAVDIFVATFSGVQKDDGPAFSYSVWADGVPTLLPRTDEIFFCSEADEDSKYRVPWDQVVEAVGFLMTPDEEMYPPRWFVDQYPTAEQFQAMGAKAF
jgi:hypothetical protein